MISEIPDNLSDEERLLLMRLSRPLPLRVRREMDVCVDMDHFQTALEATRAVLSTVVIRPTEMSPYASPAALQASWRDGLAELQASFEKTDLLAKALIRSINVMLVLE